MKDQQIVRTIYYRLLDKIVQLGYNVDDRLYGNTPEEAERYARDIENLKAQKKFIDITSESSRRNRGEITAPEFNIHLSNVLLGDIGSEPSALFPAENGVDYFLGALPGQASILIVEIYITTSTSNHTFLLNNIMYQAFGKRKYLPMYDDPEEHFFIQQTVMERMDDPGENIKDMRVVYQVPDIYLGDIEVLRANIVPIKEIKVNIGPNTDELKVQSEP